MRLFFRNFVCRQRVPFSSFLIFCSICRIEVSKSPKGLLFPLFWHYETVSKFSFFVLFQKIFSNFFEMSLKGPPFIFFRYFAMNWIFRKSKSSFFTILKTLRFLSLRYSADFRRSHLVFIRRILTK